MESVDRSKCLLALRELAGLAVEEVSTKTGVPAATVRVAERGSVPADVVRQLAAFYDLDGRDFVQHGSLTSEVDKDMSIFLFSGDLPGLDPGDLPILRDALMHARRWAKAEPCQDGLALRLARQAIAPKGPQPRDAARQGYALARELRGALGMFGEPLGDLSTLVKEKVGILASVERLHTDRLHAAAVRDRSRAAAAIVLGDEKLSTRRQRVVIAHELCHLVFDPDTGPVTLTLDTENGAGSRELGECRARGFAAEFLMPIHGLVALLGTPKVIGDKGSAGGLIRTAARHFGTPWEIAANHLFNHNFISWSCWTALRFRPQALGAPPAMELPVGAPPQCVEHLEDGPLEAHTLARQAWRCAEETQSRMTIELRGRAAEAVGSFSIISQEDPMKAAIQLTLVLDQAFESGSIGLVDASLREIDPWLADGDAVVAVLSNIQGACLQFGGPLSDIFHTLAARTLDALDKKWGWDVEDIDEARQALC